MTCELDREDERSQANSLSVMVGRLCHSLEPTECEPTAWNLPGAISLADTIEVTGVGVASAKACSDNTLHHARSHRGPAGDDTIH